jgi:hypothetical protein
MHYFALLGVQTLLGNFLLIQENTVRYVPCNSVMNKSGPRK